MHLIIPYASARSPACAQAQATLQLPHLRELLAWLSPPAGDGGGSSDEFTKTPPHERALARALGLYVGDGCIAWAAWDLRQRGTEPGEQAWAWITPCHWQAGTDHITMLDPQALNLEADESQALLAAMQPYFAEDGVTLTYQEPLRWLASGELLRDLPTASLDRVVGREVNIWMPDAPAGRMLRRLQSEMQMLFYQHPVNDRRTEGGELPVNSFWLSGTGALPASVATIASAPHPQWVDGLRLPALHDDAAAWQQAWAALDAGLLAESLTRVRSGHSLVLTLCGERASTSFATPVRSSWQRLRGRLHPLSVTTVLEAL